MSAGTCTCQAGNTTLGRAKGCIHAQHSCSVNNVHSCEQEQEQRLSAATAPKQEDIFNAANIGRCTGPKKIDGSVEIFGPCSAMSSYSG